MPEKAELSFRAVNRPGQPGYDASLQRHHLLPRQLFHSPAIRGMLDGIGTERLGFDDFRRNGLLLPADDAAAVRIGLPLHRGPHRHYNQMVFERVGQIEAAWSAKCFAAPMLAIEEAAMRLVVLQSALRRRFLSGAARPLKLNNRDPAGQPKDFSALDAMAETLWRATEPSV